jgi:large exoprotein involved in heme utilization and adhesion
LRAFNNANGGNVTINADNSFVVARTGVNQNNDIIANASKGKGGNIEITTQGILGIQEHRQSPLTNDIDASSQFGLNGNIDINQLNTDPSRGLTELPNVPTDVTNQIAAACPTTVEEADRLGSFIVSGRGGLPPNPTELLGDDNILTEWVTSSEPGSVRIEIPESNQPIVEAQGWVVNPQGKIMLVAQAAPQDFKATQCQH